jgi:hypothetical protein
MVKHSTPYVLTGLGLLLGLTILLFVPFSTSKLNYFVGGAFLTVAAASITYMIVSFSGPNDRRPDF